MSRVTPHEHSVEMVQYSIINKVPSSDGLSRAITFNGEGQTVTVSFDDSTASKQWIVEDYDGKTQSISPVDPGDGLQCAWGQDVVTVLPAHNYVWTITQNEDDPTTYTIQDGDETVYWGLGSTDVNTEVTISGEKTETGEQSWKFVKAQFSV